MIVCDGCEASWHLDCLPQECSVNPVGNWYCSACSAHRKPQRAEIAPHAAPPSRPHPVPGWREGGRPSRMI
eukprot:scaffold462730_cov55-Prasinocladus_malaysianus.AAC.1